MVRDLPRHWALSAITAALALSCSSSAADPSPASPASEEDGASTGAASDAAGDDGSSSETSEGAPTSPPLDSLTLHIAGDSTAARFSASDATGRVGWGSVLQGFFSESVRVNDAARSGRSSKSFIDEGHWEGVKAQIETGDYVFVQFAHNDEKSEDPLRYTEPGTTFKEHLSVYLDDTLERGGRPVLLTPISRLEYDGVGIEDTHGDYPEAMMELAEATETPLIDMTEKTRVLLESMGPADALGLFAEGDRTHLSAEGAVVVARLVVESFGELGLSPLVERLAPDVSPAATDGASPR